MKKKILGVLLLLLPVLFLTACSNDSLDGTYYYITDDYNWEFIEIKGDSGIADSHEVKIDKELKTFTYYNQRTSKYEYKDGVLKTTAPNGWDGTFYKKGTQAYKDALKKYHQKETNE